MCLQISCKEDPPSIAKCKLEVSKKRVSQGEKINFSLSTKPIIEGTKAKYYFDGVELAEQELSIKNLALGKHRLLAEMIIGDSIICDSYKTIEVYSEIKPAKRDFSILNSFSHNSDAYTQGLVMYEGNLYEGTGQYEESMLAKVKLANGSYDRKIDLPDEFFGEGVCVLRDKIYQLTWQSQTCFVYDLNTFELQDEFSYKSKEGWGLTTDGEFLIMSDGTNILTYINPENYDEVKQVEVYSGRDKQVNLNELEYVNGEIFANVYQENKIVIIEAKSGKVTSFLDCSELTMLAMQNASKNRIDVLNGIAYNEKKGTLYLTGKWWPTLFEISLN